MAIPEVMLSTLSSIYDALSCLPLLRTIEDTGPEENPFQAEIVSMEQGDIPTASGFPIAGQRLIDEVEDTDIVIIPSLMVAEGEWKTGRYPALVDWLTKMHARGSTLCSACSGVLLLAETGLLDGQEATIHWAYTRTFREKFPKVRLRIEKVLVIAGDRQQLVMSGASASWHDLILYLVSRHVGPAMAQAIAKFMLLQWHEEGQAPYAVFQARTDHGDAAVLASQEWIHNHFSVGNPVEKMVGRAGMPERTFKRRFRAATGYTPIEYVQSLRIESAKRWLERTGDPIEDISWKVGYEDPAFFRRLFKRVTGLSPGVYRRKFQLPAYALPEDPGNIRGSQMDQEWRFRVASKAAGNMDKRATKDRPLT